MGVPALVIKLNSPMKMKMKRRGVFMKNLMDKVMYLSHLSYNPSYVCKLGRLSYKEPHTIQERWE